jgi:flavin reductase (DIM6/NTAB) family NADH-FMN oxidoreductase RutF
MRDFHSYRPGEGHRLAHEPANSIVAPRPIGWISTVSTRGIANLAPFSLFNLFSYRPLIIGFSSGAEKDSVRNARETGEFVWNLVGRDLADAMILTGDEVGPNVDEFDMAGIEKLASVDVAPPRVAASLAQFECKVTEIVHLKDMHGVPSDFRMVFGQVVHVHIDPACIVDGVYQTTHAVPVSRGGGPADYYEARADTRFQKRRRGPITPINRPREFSE